MTAKPSKRTKNRAKRAGNGEAVRGARVRRRLTADEYAAQKAARVERAARLEPLYVELSGVDRSACVYCGAPILRRRERRTAREPWLPGFDHVPPLSRADGWGGPFWLVPSCQACNSDLRARLDVCLVQRARALWRLLASGRGMRADGRAARLLGVERRGVSGELARCCPCDVCTGAKVGSPVSRA